MSMPVRTLPVLQNWDCQECTECCRQYLVAVTPEEKKRIDDQQWSTLPEFQGRDQFVNRGSRRRPKHFLAHREDGACVFLGANNRCRIHEKFGSAAKPLACRVYPFMLVPAGDHWRVGLRFACPSAAENRGRPLSDHLGELRQYATGLETQESIPADMPPPALQGKQAVTWNDVILIARALSRVVGASGESMERKLRKCLALAHMCRQSKFDKITGERLEEFLEILTNALDTEVPPAADVPPPTSIGRVLFRQMLALYVRKDSGKHAGIAKKGRLALLKAALQFARGSGTVPQVHSLLPDTTFEKLEEPIGGLPPEADQLLVRYFQIKLESLQFAGKTNFNFTVWDGLESLVLVYPAVMWLARAFVPSRGKPEAVRLALRIVDDSFGFHPLLGTSRQKLALNILSFRNEITRLIAWYGR
jgi:lysine-N-methylase